MIFLIVKVENERATKYLEYTDMQEAQDKLAELLPTFPGAFIHNTSETRVDDLRITGGGVTIDPRVDPPLPVRVTIEDIVREILGDAAVDAAISAIRSR